jgi:hypothetical protein
MTMQQAMTLSNTDELYGLINETKHPVLLTDEYDVSYGRRRCYVVIIDVVARQWINLHLDLHDNHNAIARAYTNTVDYTQNLDSLCRACKDSTKWQVLSWKDLEAVNNMAYSDIPHLREPYGGGVYWE